jgi:hypothetical protein
VAHALLRAASPLLGMHGLLGKTCSHECEHGTLESVRHANRVTKEGQVEQGNLKQGN